MVTFVSKSIYFYHGTHFSLDRAESSCHLKYKINKRTQSRWGPQCMSNLTAGKLSSQWTSGAARNKHNGIMGKSIWLLLRRERERNLIREITRQQSRSLVHLMCGDELEKLKTAGKLGGRTMTGTQFALVYKYPFCCRCITHPKGKCECSTRILSYWWRSVIKRNITPI